MVTVNTEPRVIESCGNKRLSACFEQAIERRNPKNCLRAVFDHARSCGVWVVIMVVVKLWVGARRPIKFVIQVATRRLKRATIEHRLIPSEFVVLRVVCNIARNNHRIDRRAGKRADLNGVSRSHHGFGNLHRQKLLRTIRADVLHHRLHRMIWIGEAV